MPIDPSILHFFWLGFVHFATVISILLTLLLVSQILRSPRVPATTMGWLIVIIFIPLLGIPLYLTFGIRKLNALIQRKSKLNLPCGPNSHHHPVNSLLSSLGIPSSSEDNLVHFHQDGREAWQELLQLLEGAQDSIDIAIFILGDDQVGQEIISCLRRKAAQGIKIRLLLDGIGSFKLSKKLLRPLIEHGGEVAWFMPVIHRPLRGSANLRNHRKIIIADKKMVWSGGRNLDSSYLTPGHRGDRWIDLSFSQQGGVVATFCAIFEADWSFALNLPEKEQNITIAAPPAGQSRVQIIPSGPDIAADPIYAATLTACYGANQRILLVTPYYVPDTGVQEALNLAALRGITVNLILPEKSNHRLADIARNRYLRELHAAGAHIWFVPEKMVHAKALIIDTTFAMAGSANMDIRSLFMNFEVMSAFYSEADIHWLSSWVEGLQNQSDQYHPPSVGAFQEMVEGIVLLGAFQL